MTSTIHARGDRRYKITRTGHSHDLSYWCDCLVAEHSHHWHLLSQHRTVSEALAAITTAEHARRLVSP